MNSADEYHDLVGDWLERVGTTDIATLDQRHFRSLKPETGGDAFRLLPLDL